MTFRAPMWLWLLAAVPLIATFLLLRERNRLRLARRFVSERLRGVASPARAVRPWMLTIAIAAFALAIAGPYSGFTLVPVSGRESNRVFAIDVSNSMAAEDVGTSRLAAAKAIAKRLVDAHGGRVALIAFEGSAEVVSPLTNDTAAVAALIDTLQPGEVGEPGSDFSAAIVKAIRIAEVDATAKADVVIITDGEEQGAGRLTETLTRARSRGIRISAIVIGSAKGSPIPTGDGILREESGRSVTTYADTAVMERVTKATGGTLYENPFAANALDGLMVRTAPGRARESHVRVPIDRFQFPLALAFAAFFFASFLNRGAE